MGFDGLFFGRIDYADKDKRLKGGYEEDATVVTPLVADNVSLADHCCSCDPLDYVEEGVREIYSQPDQVLRPLPAEQVAAVGSYFRERARPWARLIARGIRCMGSGRRTLETESSRP